MRTPILCIRDSFHLQPMNSAMHSDIFIGSMCINILAECGTKSNQKCPEDRVIMREIDVCISFHANDFARLSRI